MARTGKYGHGADGRRPPQRAAAAGYDYCLVAENIAYQYRSSGFESADALAQALVEGWKRSPEHRHNMLLGNATETGTGIAQGEGGRYFAVQMFGRPSSAEVRFSIENRSGQPVRYSAGERSFTLEPRVTRTHTLCRRPELSIEAPDGGEPFRAQPEDGARYTVTARGVQPAPRRRGGRRGACLRPEWGERLRGGGFFRSSRLTIMRSRRQAPCRPLKAGLIGTAPCLPF
jgi:hypothetical protein